MHSLWTLPGSCFLLSSRSSHTYPWHPWLRFHWVRFRTELSCSSLVRSLSQHFAVELHCRSRILQLGPWIAPSVCPTPSLIWPHTPCRNLWRMGWNCHMNRCLSLANLVSFCSLMKLYLKWRYLRASYWHLEVCWGLPFGCSGCSLPALLAKLPVPSIILFHALFLLYSVL